LGVGICSISRHSTPHRSDRGDRSAGLERPRVVQDEQIASAEVAADVREHRILDAPVPASARADATRPVQVADLGD
jgi:hypothetical protein